MTPYTSMHMAVLLAGLLAADGAAPGPTPPPTPVPAPAPLPEAPPQSAATVNVQDFGAKGDGVADDYEAIQAAVARINAQGGGVLVFPKGVYRVARHRIDAGPKANGITNFVFQGCTDLTIDGQGSKLDLDGDWVRTADYVKKATYSYQNAVGLVLRGCKGVHVRDLEIDGNADLTTKEAVAEGPSHGISIEGSQDVSIERVWIHHMQADGLYVTMTWDPPGQVKRYKVTRNLQVTDSRFTNNARQGMSIIQARHAKFFNCDFSYTGQTGKYGGHAPQAGVDIEPNRWPGAPAGWEGDDFTGDVVFSGCRFVENGGFEYVGTNETTTPHPVTFIGCTFSDVVGAFRPAVATGTVETRFLGCTFQNVSLAPFYGTTAAPTSVTEVAHSRFESTDPAQRVLQYGRSQGRLLVHDNVFRLAGAASAGAYRLYLDGDGSGEFVDNLVLVDGREHAGKGRDLRFLLRGLKRVEGNQWRSDLARPEATFGISTDRTPAAQRPDALEGGRFRVDGPVTRGERPPR